MTDSEEMDILKKQIAELFGRREQLKKDIDNGNVSFRQGMRELEPIDKELSALDLRYKQLWDAQNN